MDNLSADMIKCRKDGFGCHYGAWKALQPIERAKKEKPKNLDDGRRVCEWCKTEFYYYGKGNRRFCGNVCYQSHWYQKKREERKAANGQGEDAGHE
jgi:hypothetical protein